MQQLSLFDSDRRRELNMKDAIEWVQTNPHAWAYMERYALEAARHGRRFGVKALVERVRWEVAFVEGKPYKVNNSLAPAFGRMLLAAHPELEGHLEIRESHFDGEVVPPKVTHV